MLAGKTLAITGIGGFIGARLAARAHDWGMTVRGLDASPSAGRRVGRGIEIVTGDVADPAALRKLLKGADYVVHTAAVVTEHGDPKAFKRINEEAPALVAKEAQAASVKAMVHLSTVMVYGFSYAANVAEDAALTPVGNLYCDSKIAGEQALWKAFTRGKLRVVVLRPGDVIGPGSVPWLMRPVTFMKAGRFALPRNGKGVLNPVHVEHLVDAILTSLERDVSGVYNVTDGVTTTCESYFGALASWLQFTIPRYPTTLMRAYFGMLALAERAKGKQPEVHPSAIDFLLRENPYSNERAKRDLGYSPRIPLDTALLESRAWLESEKLVRESGAAVEAARALANVPDPPGAPARSSAPGAAPTEPGQLPSIPSLQGSLTTGTGVGRVSLLPSTGIKESALGTAGLGSRSFTPPPNVYDDILGPASARSPGPPRSIREELLATPLPGERLSLIPTKPASMGTPAAPFMGGPPSIPAPRPSSKSGAPNPRPPTDETPPSRRGG
jgi:nucleoside-diphosphate-sugar epimerase